MSFKCDSIYGCGTVQPQGTQPTRKILKTRKRIYEARAYRHNKRNLEDPGGEGTEIVKEVVFCQACSSKSQ